MRLLSRTEIAPLLSPHRAMDRRLGIRHRCAETDRTLGFAFVRVGHVETLLAFQVLARVQLIAAFTEPAISRYPAPARRERACCERVPEVVPLPETSSAPTNSGLPHSTARNSR
jgi:hypothetical protein